MRSSSLQSGALILLGLSALLVSPWACTGPESPGVGAGGDGANGSVAGGAVGGTSAAGGSLHIVIPAVGGRDMASAGGTGPVPDVGYLKVCEYSDGTMSAGDPSGSLLIDDFDEEDSFFSGNGLRGGWGTYSDYSGGTIEPTDMLPEPGGPSGQGSVLHVQSSGFSSWGSGFSMLFATQSDLGGQECVFDATEYQGITFWARGSMVSTGDVPWDEGDFKVSLNEKDDVPIQNGGRCPEGPEGYDGYCWSPHKRHLTLDNCWHRYVLPFSSFRWDNWGHSGGELNVDELYSMTFEATHNQDWEVWLDDVSFYVTPPAEEDSCENLGMAGAAAL